MAKFKRTCWYVEEPIRAEDAKALQQKLSKKEMIFSRSDPNLDLYKVFVNDRCYHVTVALTELRGWRWNRNKFMDIMETNTNIAITLMNNHNDVCRKIFKSHYKYIRRSLLNVMKGRWEKTGGAYYFIRSEVIGGING